VENCLHAEIRTEWAQEELERQQRRPFFDAMVQAIKRVPSSQTRWEPAPHKRWVIRGAGAAPDLVRSFSELGFSFPPVDLQRFCEEGRHLAASQAVPLPFAGSQADPVQRLAFREKEAPTAVPAPPTGLPPWASAGGPSGKGAAAPPGARGGAPLPERPPPPPPVPPVAATAAQPPPPGEASEAGTSEPLGGLGPGARVCLHGVMSKPHLNGRVGRVERRGVQQRWVVRVDGATLSCRAEQLELLGPFIEEPTASLAAANSTVAEAAVANGPSLAGAAAGAGLPAARHQLGVIQAGEEVKLPGPRRYRLDASARHPRRLHRVLEFPSPRQPGLAAAPDAPAGVERYAAALAEQPPRPPGERPPPPLPAAKSPAAAPAEPGPTMASLADSHHRC